MIAMTKTNLKDKLKPKENSTRTFAQSSLLNNKFDGNSKEC